MPGNNARNWMKYAIFLIGLILSGCAGSRNYQIIPSNWTFAESTPIKVVTTGPIERLLTEPMHIETWSKDGKRMGRANSFDGKTVITWREK